MSTVLYITANPKDEKHSISKQIGRDFVERYRSSHPNDTIIELDLYKEKIPYLDLNYFSGRGKLLKGNDLNKLSPEDQNTVKRIHNYAVQFASADKYIISVPMWSFLFPAPLKAYLDSVILFDTAIRFSLTKGVVGTLDDKPRKLLYIETAGGTYSEGKLKGLDYGTKYIKDLFSFLGIKEFHNILAEGTGMKITAIGAAHKEVDRILKIF